MNNNTVLPGGKTLFLQELRAYILSVQEERPPVQFSLDFSPGAFSNYPGLKEELSEKEAAFADELLRIIKEKGLTNAEVYNAAGIDRRHFSKIVTGEDYKPEKDTCLVLALALRLTLPEATDLLQKAGYAFSHSSRRDIIIEYFFKRKIYDKFALNEVLVDMAELPLR